MPPNEHLVQETLVPTVIRNDVVRPLHEILESAVGGLYDHDPRVEDGDVVSHGGDLGEVEEEVEVAQHDDVGVDEDDLVVVGELPEPELAVVVLVVGVLLGLGVADAGDDADLPAGRGEGGALGDGDGGVEEEEEVAVRSGLEEALG